MHIYITLTTHTQALPSVNGGKITFLFYKSKHIISTCMLRHGTAQGSSFLVLQLWAYQC